MVKTLDRAMLVRARQVAQSVPDPELPMVTLADLGILREVAVTGQRVVVSLTPTYAGCPAIAEIRAEVASRLAAAGFADVEVRTVLSPPWTSDFISPAGRRKLAEAGIAPPRFPHDSSGGTVPLTLIARRSAGRLPGLRVGRYGADGGVQRNRLQGPLPLPGLCGAVRARERSLT